MARPKKVRFVEFVPPVQVFKPVGVPRYDLEEIVLSLEELEAIRLRNLEDLEQEECAQRMSISRPTFQRILNQAYEKVARMLTEGLALRVEGGTYKLIERRRCSACQQKFALPLGSGPETKEDLLCPKCYDALRPGRRRRRRGRHSGRER
ncbi:MAG: DUF134 domain-containing protein [Firmicutes bacterium]|nr:DUF134 domain-containing protein [Bacillota bacterium]